MHTGQDDNLMVLQGSRYVDIFEPKTKSKASFVLTPNKIYKNEKLYYHGPAMVVWPVYQLCRTTGDFVLKMVHMINLILTTNIRTKKSKNLYKVNK